MKTYNIILISILVMAITATNIFAQDYFMNPGQTITVDNQDITLQSVSDNQTLFVVGDKNKIIHTGNSGKFQDFRIFVKEAGLLNDEDEEETAHVSICKIESEELCNGIDDNCDGNVDDVSKDCGLGIGICVMGRQECINGEWGYCNSPTSQNEICNGLDDNCDGTIDEGLSERSCGLGLGICTGSQRCENGVWTSCTAREPTKEVCNGKDDDCDGNTDNGLVDCSEGNFVVSDDISKAEQNVNNDEEKKIENYDNKQNVEENDNSIKEKETSINKNDEKDADADTSNDDDINAITGNAVKEENSDDNSQDVTEIKSETTIKEKGLFGRFWEWFLRII